MPAIRIGQEFLVLDGKTQVALIRNSPLLQDEGERGNTSLPINAARVPHNDRILGYPARFDHMKGRPPGRFEAELLDENGAVLVAGTLILRRIEPDAYVLNLEFGASEVMARLKTRRLKDFRFGGVQIMRPQVPVEPNNWIGAALRYMREGLDNWNNEKAIFAPVSNDDANGGWDAAEAAHQSFDANKNKPAPHYQSFNTWGNFFVGDPDEVTGEGFTYVQYFAVIGPVQASSVNVMPLPRLAYVLPEIFREMRLPLITDLFDDPEMLLTVLIPANSIMGYFMPENPTSGDDGYLTYRIADHLPDLSAAEFIRSLMDTFGLHFDTTITGECRLLRSRGMVQSQEPVDLTSLVGARFSREPNNAVQVVVSNQIADADRYTQELAGQPDPEQITQEPVDQVADLPTATGENQFILVTSQNRYYKTVQTTTPDPDPSKPAVQALAWQPGPYFIPNQVVGDVSEETEEMTVGTALVVHSLIDIPYQDGPGFSKNVGVPIVTFLEPSYNPDTCSHPRSKTVRLAFYRGLRPVPGQKTFEGYQAHIPWLTQENYDVDGKTIIGRLSLRAAGRYGLVSKFLRPLALVRAARDVVQFPSYLTPNQYQNLDFARLARIQGNLFLLRQARITLPLQKPGILEMVPADLANIDVDLDEVLTCDLVLVEVELNPDETVATILVDKARGGTLYSLNGSPEQASNVFTDLVPGTTYTYIVKDQGLENCTITGTFETTPLPATCQLQEPTVTFDGFSATLAVAGGQGTLRYSLNGGPPRATGLFEELEPNVTYSYLITDDVVAGCKKEGSFTTPKGVCNLVEDQVPITTRTSAYFVVRGATRELVYQVQGFPASDTPLVTGLYPGQTFNYTITDPNAVDCQITGSFTTPTTGDEEPV